MHPKDDVQKGSAPKDVAAKRVAFTTSDQAKEFFTPPRRVASKRVAFGEDQVKVFRADRPVAPRVTFGEDQVKEFRADRPVAPRVTFGENQVREFDADQPVDPKVTVDNVKESFKKKPAVPKYTFTEVKSEPGPSILKRSSHVDANTLLAEQQMNVQNSSGGERHDGVRKWKQKYDATKTRSGFAERKAESKKL